VLASVTVFFYTQNTAAVTRVLIGDTTIDRSIEAEVGCWRCREGDERGLEAVGEGTGVEVLGDECASVCAFGGMIIAVLTVVPCVTVARSRGLAV
jgi:hypothetical protein